MTARALVGALAGLGAGFGVLLVLQALRPEATRLRPRRSVRSDGGSRVVAGIGMAVVVLLLTRWFAAAVGLGLLAAAAPWFFGGGRVSRAAMDRLDALAVWAEALRDLVATGAALPEAIPRTLDGAPVVLRAALANLAGRLTGPGREPLDVALLAMADELDDPAADLLVATLVLNARVQGRQLVTVLSGLAVSLRAELDVRRTIEADRRATRRAVQVVIAVTVGMVLGLATLNPGYVAPYRRPAGQLMLAVVVAVYGTGFVWLRRLADFGSPGRFLADSEGARP